MQKDFLSLLNKLEFYQKQGVSLTLKNLRTKVARTHNALTDKIIV